MAFKIKDGVRIGTTDVFNNAGTLLVNAPTATKIASAVTIALSGAATGTATSFDGSANITIPVTALAAGNLSGTIPTAVLGNSSTFIGTTSVALNRASGALSLTGVSIDGNAGTVTNGVYTTGDQTIAGTKTFSSTISGSITGNAGTVTNGIYTTGSYADPSWITSLAKSKVGLSNVENTALSTWAGSTNLTTIGAATATSLTVTGNLVVNGTTTTVNSTTVTLDDPILTLGGDTAPSSDDGKDRGIEFRWHNGTSAKLGFFGFDDSTGKFTFIPDATNTSEVFSGTKGVLDAQIEWADILNKPAVGTGTVTSVELAVPTGLTVSGSPITTSGTLTIALASGYSIPTTAKQTEWDTAYTDRNKWDGGATGLVAATGRTSLGATTVGSNLFTLTNPSAIRFIRVNADNTVSALSATDFRTAIGAGTSSTTGTVTSVSGTGTVSGLSLSGTVTSSGNITLSGTLAVTASNFSSQTANTFLAAPNGTAGVPTFRAIVAADIPTLNQNTTGTAANVTGTVAIANGGTGATTNTQARTNLGATTLGSNLFTITNPGAITFPRFNADNTVSALSASDFRTAIGALGAEADTLATVTGRGATTATAVSLTNTTDSTTSSTGALVVTGGVAVNKNLFVAGDILGATSDGTTIISATDNVAATVATTAATAIDTWAVATYRSAKYIVQITQGTNYQVSEVMVIHNGTTTTMTEYAVLETNGALGNFTADVSGGNARLLVTMATATSATIKIQKVLVTV